MFRGLPSPLSWRPGMNGDVLAEVRNLSKRFFHSEALKNLDLEIFKGETLGIVGHNGAGKSTLVNILIGTFPPTGGEIFVEGAHVPEPYSVHVANALGIRAVFQELSLCPNLTVIENMKVFHPSLRGRGWRRRAEETIMEVLDILFPGHGIDPNTVIEELPLGQRQMVEIAKAFTVVDQPIKLVILDEPTSALDTQRTGQLIHYLNTIKSKEMGCIYISHLLDEVLACTQRIVVLKDGKKVGTLNTKEANRNKIIELMGEAKPEIEEVPQAGKTAPSTNGEKTRMTRLIVEPLQTKEGKVTFRVHKGEIVGLAGLAGHGQTKLLLDLFDYQHNDEFHIEGPVTFIPGDRQTEGVFPLWSIVKNITVQVYDKVKRLVLIDPKKEEKIAERWKMGIDIKASTLNDTILSLSGGNQQKVLFARCLESSAPLVLMDDPTRGVDVGTKEEIYKLILKEKERGRSFVWYTTEMDELKYCDRIYVFKSGKIIAELSGSDATEEEILKSSF